MCNNEHLQRKCCKDILLVNLLSQCFHPVKGPRSHGPHAYKIKLENKNLVGKAPATVVGFAGLGALLYTASSP